MEDYCYYLSIEVGTLLINHALRQSIEEAIRSRARGTEAIDLKTELYEWHQIPEN